MRAAPLVLTLGLILLTTAPDATASGEESRPLAAYVTGTSLSVTLSWIPGAQAPDAYIVYGISEEGRTLIANVDPETLSVAAPLGYDGYAVAGLVGGVETDLTRAIGVCVLIDPPSVWVGCVDVNPPP